MHEIEYVGRELDLFEHAKTWKNYYATILAPYITGNVLEVGAGIGGTTRILATNANRNIHSWLCIEPDPDLFESLREKVIHKELPEYVNAMKGTSDDVGNQKFNSILYIDVIEHIEDDRQELENAYKLLDKNGYLIILVPAHQFLFSPFDKAIGHFRRYNERMLIQAVPQELKLIKTKYLDSCGFMAAMTNKLLLKQPYPSLNQVKFWDNKLIPISKILDVVTFNKIGKTLIGIWQKGIDE